MKTVKRAMADHDRHTAIVGVIATLAQEPCRLMQGLKALKLTDRRLRELVMRSPCDGKVTKRRCITCIARACLAGIERVKPPRKPRPPRPRREETAFAEWLLFERFLRSELTRAEKHLERVTKEQKDPRDQPSANGSVLTLCGLLHGVQQRTQRICRGGAK